MRPLLIAAAAALLAGCLAPARCRYAFVGGGRDLTVLEVCERRECRDMGTGRLVPCPGQLEPELHGRIEPIMPGSWLMPRFAHCMGVDARGRPVPCRGYHLSESVSMPTVGGLQP